ncbi:flagellar hook-basal body complex protein FliE [Natribacillus halophilus]|uniref:Flagellar hook-basal body complex protein FliE n=1 Tax=Natribacillus halophilus TaxID=549003 RepID=A0A1G8PMG5_9BACI|nr:flagellar hook-basal body complex protein FliE [Natribacillus halophilus]SDI93759.1 flagellar hook-basal body complex protein FliE [Natribacillus halophilus]
MQGIQGDTHLPMPVSPLAPQAPEAADEQGEQVSASEAQNTFGNILKEALENVESHQAESEEMTQQLLNGEVENLHDVMIASEKAGVALQATVEMRDRVIDAYDNVMRMTL